MNGPNLTISSKEYGKDLMNGILKGPNETITCRNIERT